MRPYSVEIRGVGLQNAIQLPLVQNEQVIETLPPHAPQKALTARIGSRRVERGPEYLDPGPACYTCEERTKLAVVVPDQIFGRLPEGRCFSKLLSHPGISRKARHPDVDHPPGLQFDEEEGEE